VARLYDCPVTGDAEGQQVKRAPPPADVPADWYPDPDSPRTLQRYWDGESWTDDTAPLPPAPADRDSRPEPPEPATESTAVIESDDLVPIPAGWYADPDEPATRRYWDGEEWTDWTDQTYERNLNRDKDSKNDTLVMIGWITAILIPIVGLILGIVVSTRGDKRGTWVIVASIVVFLISLVILGALGDQG
jgi:hypothetical protein